MKKGRQLDIIAYIHTDFESKFGVPRQSGLVEELEARVVFERSGAGASGGDHF